MLGQVFFIKKITHTFSTNTNYIATRAELIEAPLNLSKLQNNIYIEYNTTEESYYIIADYAVASELVITISIYDNNSSTSESDVVLTIPLGKQRSDMLMGIPFCIKTISCNEDQEYIYVNGGLKQIY